MGEGGTMRFVQYSNEHIRAQQQGEAFGLYMGVRVPMFDIEVTAEKSSPYAKISQNELALQFYNEGFFEPARAQQALTCLDMMDFDHKEEIMGKIGQNGAMLQQMQMMAQLLDRAMGTTEFSEGIAQQYGVGMPSGGAAQSAPATGQQEEPANVRNARRRQAEGTSPT
jgi:chitinase